MSLSSVITTAAETTSSSGGGINPWLVGAGVLVLLLVLMGGLLIFGAGREHS